MSSVSKLDTAALSQFTGTAHWYRISPLTPAVLTDGTKYVAEVTDNLGLMQDIALDMRRPKCIKALDDGLVIVDIDTEGFGLRIMDGNEKKLCQYPLYGYPSLKIRIFVAWMERGVPCLFLPSEY